MITVDQFRTLFPNNHEPDAWVAALNFVLRRYGMGDNPQRLASFLSQCGHESCGFTDLSENLNYSAEALTANWPKRFPPAVAIQYARQPERIANRAYANRMGNGPEGSGDGWKHRGRGIIQLTGKNDYQAFAKSCGRTYSEIFDYLETKVGAIESACWYWRMKHLNVHADLGDTLALTRVINGGTNGLDDRTTRYHQAYSLLA